MPYLRAVEEQTEDPQSVHLSFPFPCFLYVASCEVKDAATYQKACIMHGWLTDSTEENMVTGNTQNVLIFPEQYCRGQTEGWGRGIPVSASEYIHVKFRDTNTGDKLIVKAYVVKRT